MLKTHINHTAYPDGRVIINEPKTVNGGVVSNEPQKDQTETDEFLLMLDEYRREYRRSRFIALFWESLVILMILTASAILGFIIIAKSDHLQTMFDQFIK